VNSIDVDVFTRRICWKILKHFLFHGYQFLHVFIVKPGWLDYNNRNIYGKSLFQPEYRIKKAFGNNCNVVTPVNSAWCSPVRLTVLEGHLDLDYMHVGRRLQSATTATMGALLSSCGTRHGCDDRKCVNETAGRVLMEVLWTADCVTVSCFLAVTVLQWQRLFSSTSGTIFSRSRQWKLTSLSTAPDKLKFRVVCGLGRPTV